MRKRKKLSNRQSAKRYRKGKRTHKANKPQAFMRSGIRR